MAESSSLRQDDNVVNSKKQDADTSGAPSHAEASAMSAPSAGCDTAASASAATSENTAEAANSETSSEADNMVVPEEAKAVFEMVARQVEYYFSTTNLQKDTYVSTLRSLNDGYVPISIIANFGKVRSMVPYDSINAVKQAATTYSDLLEIVQISTATGKKVEQAKDASDQLLEAVGPVSGNPIPAESLLPVPKPTLAPILSSPIVSGMSAAASSYVMPAAVAPAPVVPAMIPVVQQQQVQATPSSTPTSAVQNTFILREVPSNATEAQIRELFAFDKCPTIKDLHPDVAQCWYVTLDTESRDDMLMVMFALRDKQYPNGERIQVRLKSLPSALAVVSDPNAMPVPSAQQMAPVYSMYQQQQQPKGVGRNNGGGRNKNRKKKMPNSAGGRGNSASGNTNSINTHASKGFSGSSANARAKNAGSAQTTRRAPHAKVDGSNNAVSENQNGNSNQQRKQPSSSEHTSSPSTSTDKGASIASTETQGLQQTPKQSNAKSQPPAPPALGEEQFPALNQPDGNDLPLTKSSKNDGGNAAGSSKKVEVEVAPHVTRSGGNSNGANDRPEGDDNSSCADGEKQRVCSDGASTATTSSSTSSSKQMSQTQNQVSASNNFPVGGYAAALMKAAPPKPPTPVATASGQPSAANHAKKDDRSVTATDSATKSSNSRSGRASAGSDKTTDSRRGGAADRSRRGRKQQEPQPSGRSKNKPGKHEDAASQTQATASPANANPAVVVTPPSWGGGRSFADVLKKEDTAKKNASATKQ